jgi:hypothetical protein
VQLRRPAAGLIVLALAALLAGCQGEEKGSSGSDLPAYHGEGFTVGYPPKWQRNDKRPIFGGAEFEVIAPHPKTELPQAVLSVFEEDEIEPINQLVDRFLALSRTDDGFRLLERTRRDLNGTEFYIVRKAYTDEAGLRPVQLRQVDMIFRAPTGKVIDIRMSFIAKSYDAAAVRAVIHSVQVGTA